MQIFTNSQQQQKESKEQRSTVKVEKGNSRTERETETERERGGEGENENGKQLAKKVHKICTRSVKIVHKTHATLAMGQVRQLPREKGGARGGEVQPR